jgi:formylglycine-generating enzyme required for sulfatase activity
MENRIIKIDENIILEFQWIPPGEFMIGSPETENGHEESESPQHRVRLASGFWMGKYPVTQQQWQTLMGFKPSKFVDMRHPVEMVNWNDAQKFILRLNELDRGTFRHPTEAEWEYACRSQTTTRFYSGDSERDLDSVAWYAANSDAHPHPVGKKGPNEFCAVVAVFVTRRIAGLQTVTRKRLMEKTSISVSVSSCPPNLMPVKNRE